MNLSNKAALVTGSSRGIGRAVAQELARVGARVAVHYHTDRTTAEQALASLDGSGHVLLHADVADPDSATNLVEATVKEFGRIDILVNNAGIFDLHPPLELSYDQWVKAWNRTVGTNLIGAANVSFCAIRQMLKQGGGRIINISSRGAFRGEPDAPAYGASKAGMNAMSQSLAKALAPQKILVFAVAPGFVQTERIMAKLNPEQAEEIRNQSPLGRMSTPEEVAHTVLFLATEAPEALTGCIVDINGASYLRT